MNCKIPFTKDIDFEKKLYEITSISLEHEISIVDNTLKGNFIVSGEYKSHEVSVNKEAFSYLLPFEIEILPDVDHDSIEFMIEDFTYEIVETNILRVKIDFNVIGSKIEKEEEEVEEAIFRDVKEESEEKLLGIEETLEIKEEEVKKVEIEEKKEVEETSVGIEIEEEKVIEEPVVEEIREEEREQIMVNTEEIKKETEETIIDTIKGANDEYATYHIHMVSDGETVETICTMYNSNLNILSEYNDLNDLTSGDKLIIPEKDE